VPPEAVTVTQVESAITYALAQQGKPYKFGTKGPNTFDCSGLMVASYEHAQPPLRLPHWTGALILIGTEVKKADLLPGDLVFPDSGHVQLYLGNGQVIHAPHAGASVEIVSMDRFWRARRVAEGGSSFLGNVKAFAGGVLGEIPNPFGAAATLVDVFRPVGAAAYTIVNPNFWRRVGMGVLGGLMIGVGILYLNRRPIMETGATVLRVTGDTANTLVQGFSFGLGAGKAGGLGVSGGPAASVSSAGRTTAARVPKPPPAIAPKTRPLPWDETRPRSPIRVGEVKTGEPTQRYTGRARPYPQGLPTPKPRGAGERGALTLPF